MLDRDNKYTYIFVSFGYLIILIVSLFPSRYGRDYYINESGESKAKQNQVSAHDVGTLEKSIVHGTLTRTTFRSQNGTQNFVKNPIYREDV